MAVKNIAFNIDLTVIVVAAQEPPLPSKFIDRYLMVLQNSNIPAIICLNKCDLKTLEDETWMYIENQKLLLLRRLLIQILVLKN